MRPPMSTPLVSVVIPAHNAERTIAEAAGTALAQSVRDLEVLITDDGSTDGTLAVLHNLARRDRRVRVIETPRRGAGAARNAALDRARGQWVQFLDADDRLLPDATSRLLHAAQQTGAASGGWQLCGPEGNDLDMPAAPTPGRVGLRQLLRSNPLAISATLLARPWLERERFDPAAPAAADYDLWLRLAVRGVEFVSIRDPVAAYRLAPTTNSKRYAQGLEFVQRIITRALPAAGVDPASDDASSALDAHLLRFATAIAVREGVDQAAREWGRLWRRTPARAADLAARAFEALVHHASARPTAEGDAPWIDDVASWWVALAERGAASDAALHQAASDLARACVAPERIAQALIADAPGRATHAILLGHGRNAHRVERAAAAMGMPCRVRDDRYDAGAQPAPPHADYMRAPVHAAALLIITPDDDATLAARFPAARRWSAQARALAWPTAQRITRAIHQRRAQRFARRAA